MRYQVDYFISLNLIPTYCFKIKTCNIRTTTHKKLKRTRTFSPTCASQSPILPDPIEWTFSHIKSWLKWSSEKFSLNPKPDITQFPKSGSELCKMTGADFKKCAGNVRSGALLAKHIAHLRHSVTGRPSSPLNTDCKISDDEDKG